MKGCGFPQRELFSRKENEKESDENVRQSESTKSLLRPLGTFLRCPEITGIIKQASKRVPEEKRRENREEKVE